MTAAAIVEYPSRIQLKRIAGWRLRLPSPDAFVVGRRARATALRN